MPESTFTHPLFGAIRFRTKSNIWKRGDDITFIGGFDESAIAQVVIPQLEGIEGTHGGRLRFHKRGHSQLKAVFAALEQQGLMAHIKSCAGTLNRRLRRPTDGGLSKLPSNHAFGIAIDLNSDDGSLGASVAPVAPVFAAHGFTWGKSFNDPMHFEVNRFLESNAVLSADEASPLSQFVATRQKVHNRGRPPESFLEELVRWGRGIPATADVFARNEVFDIYSSVASVLGPWRGAEHRRAVMLEVLRVLAGFESSWNWEAGVDTTNPTSNTPCTEEAGIFQCSGNSLALSADLEELLASAGGDGSCASFITVSKTNHTFAMDYCARLLRRTTKHHGPVRDGHIHAWLRRDAVDELERHLA